MPLLVDALRRVQAPVEGVREPAVADESRGFEERGEDEGVVGGAGPSGPEACSLRAVTTSRRQQGAVGHGSAGGTTGGEQGREAEVQRREAEGAVAKGRGRKRERDVVRGSGRASRAGDVPAGGRRQRTVGRSGRDGGSARHPQQVRGARKKRSRVEAEAENGGSWDERTMSHDEKLT
jgi:hypothetical protein